jgi:hypothetical protein
MMTGRTEMLRSRLQVAGDLYASDLDMLEVCFAVGSQGPYNSE